MDKYSTEYLKKKRNQTILWLIGALIITIYDISMALYINATTVIYELDLKLIFILASMFCGIIAIICFITGLISINLHIKQNEKDSKKKETENEKSISPSIRTQVSQRYKRD